MTAKKLLIKGDSRTIDPALPRTDALPIRDGKVAALGEAARAAGLTPTDLRGRLVLPGFQDAHIHLWNGGTGQMPTARPCGATTIAELQSALAAHAAGRVAGMIWGAGWQCGGFADQNLARAVLDAGMPDRPCLIHDGSFHNAGLNGVALARISDPFRSLTEAGAPHNRNSDRSVTTEPLCHHRRDRKPEAAPLAGAGPAVLARTAPDPGRAGSGRSAKRRCRLLARPSHRPTLAGLFRRPDRAGPRDLYLRPPCQCPDPGSDHPVPGSDRP